MKDTKNIANSCVPLDRSPAAVALALVLGLMLLIVGLVQATAAERPAGPDVVCERVTLPGDTTASAGGVTALADITICYRPLPAAFWGPEPGPAMRAAADAEAGAAIVRDHI